MLGPDGMGWPDGLGGFRVAVVTVTAGLIIHVAFRERLAVRSCGSFGG
jgi:hypothetical protein